MVSSFSCHDKTKAKERGVFTRDLAVPGKVVSVYAKAINILTSENLIVSLVENHTQMTPLSICLPALFRGSEAQEGRVKPGDRAKLEARGLTISGLSVDLGSGEIWEGTLVPDDVRNFRPFKIPLLGEALLEKGKKGGLLGLICPGGQQDPFVKKASGVLDRVFTEQHDTREIRGLSQLVGLGIGFTPSGDDFISGVLLGDRIVDLSSASQKELTETARGTTGDMIGEEEIWDALDKTNYGGRTLLWQALQGHFPYYMIDAARGLAEANNDKEMKEMVGRAASHGETSGTDALVGLFLYLDRVVG